VVGDGDFNRLAPGDDAAVLVELAGAIAALAVGESRSQRGTIRTFIDDGRGRGVPAGFFNRDLGGINSPLQLIVAGGGDIGIRFESRQGAGVCRYRREQGQGKAYRSSGWFSSRRRRVIVTGARPMVSINDGRSSALLLFFRVGSF